MKGVTFGVQETITLLVTGVIAVGVLPFILPGQVTKISPEINASEFENKAILLANSLMANPNLIYPNNRAMFDEQKLNTNMVEKSSNQNILYCPESPQSLICKIKSYPKSFSLILVKDAERGKGWFSVMRSGSEEFDDKMKNCFSNFNVQELFKEDSRFSLADSLAVAEIDVQGCEFTRNTNILSERFEDFDMRKSPHLFPITIRDATGSVHMGWIKVMVVE